MLQLTFEYDKFGNVKRLVTLGIPYYVIRERVPGAIENRRSPGLKVTFPPDELTARRIIRLFEGIKVDGRVTEWLQEQVDFNKQMIALKSKITLDECDENVEWAYQEVDVQFMKHVKRFINGNDMGTGKTIESIKLADAINAEHVLVVCSKVKMQDWQDEIEAWSDGEVIQVNGTPKQKDAKLKTPSRWKIVTYGALRNSLRYSELFFTYWDAVFIDEAHRLRNLRSQQGKGATNLRCEHLGLLTGTAIYNKPTNLYALLHLVDPLRWSSFTTFVERFCDAEDGFGGHTNIIGIKNLEALQYVLAPIMLDRKKKDVLPWLPAKIFKKINLEMEPAQAKIYKQMAEDSYVMLGDDMIAAPTRLAQITKLRQLALMPSLLGVDAPSAKIEAILNIVEEAVESNQKVVIMSCFRGFVEQVVDVLNKEGYPTVAMHGQLSDKERELSKRRFKDDPKCVAFAATIQTAGEGLNLQHASVYIQSDPSIIPGEVKQAIERLDRSGQTRNPLIIDLVTKGTIEEDIHTVLGDKTAVVDQVMAMEMIIGRFLNK